jgi:hypothetical protein
MANFRAIFDVGDSLARYLTNAYPSDLNASYPCAFKVVSSGEIATEETSALDKLVSIFLHRITTDPFSRAATRIPDQPGKQPSLFLDLHYLITYWGTSAEAEQTILGWTMQQLQTTPILDASVLSATAGWDISEQVQLMPADLQLEDILRIWDALGPKYRLSVSYLARVVRIDRSTTDDLPVVATRFQLETSVPMTGGMQ